MTVSTRECKRGHPRRGRVLPAYVVDRDPVCALDPPWTAAMDANSQVGGAWMSRFIDAYFAAAG
jgi:hypothetical protein